MKITKNKLFFSTLIFGLIVNLLVLTNFQYLYLRAIISFGFLTIIPGLLIMMMLKIRKIGFWEYLVYTIGLSIAFLMFGGLAVNWLLPWLHITDKPLSLIPLLISFNIILLIFGVIAYIRNKDISLEIKSPKINWLNKVFFITPVVFPILSILGAITLNNGGPNYLTMIMLGGIAFYIFMAVLFKRYLNKNIYPWSILMMSISLLLMGWIRSWYVSGIDINIEYYIFQLTKNNHLWNMSLIDHVYNACISVTILPTIFSIFQNINDHYIFKLIIPLLYSVTSLCIYSLFRKYASEVIAYMAVIFFISQPTFMAWWQIPIRQEIALLFFALSLLILFSININNLLKQIIFLIFSFSMIVSHYSTVYIALAFYIFTYLLYFVIRKTFNNKYISKIYEVLKLKRRGEHENSAHNLTISLIIIPILFSIIWYFQVTSISGNFTQLGHKMINNMRNIFSNEIRSDGTSFSYQWNIFNNPVDKQQLLQTTTNNLTTYYKNISFIHSYQQDKYKDYKPEIIPMELLPQKLNLRFNSIIYIFNEIIKKLVKIFMLVGITYLLFVRFKRNNIPKEYILLTFGSFLGIIAMIILPFASLDYDLMREYQQSLIVLSLPVLYGAFLFFKFIKIELLKSLAIVIVLLLFYLFQSGFIPQIIGGSSPSLQLNNFGISYDQLFVHKSEIASSSWLFNNNLNNQLIYADDRASDKLSFSNNYDKNKQIKYIFPPIIDKYAYVYSSYTNTINNMAIVFIHGNSISYKFPTEFLNENKNIIYNNGSTKIYK